ncbi:MAG: hypothetical protein HN856_05335 [Gammaproteobacteria bacterium]|nr:hypothetical protein [Gammaproteobacteria bacterium]
MTPLELSRLAAREDVQANIISDGQHDYVVEIVGRAQTALLRKRGRVMRFRSLSEVHTLLRRSRVAVTVLKQRVAHDEACGPAEGAGLFSMLPLRFADKWR